MNHADRRTRAEGVAFKFGENLLRCRRRAGFSQEELGVRASLHRTEIGLLENGRRLARVDTVIQLAGALSIDPAELLEGIHWNAGDVASGRFAISQRPVVPRRRGQSD
ncbi:MAG TPA: helix-turn-helix transcriptional regulator [Solirubrobacterales bacterium]|nr:helix-turn-helix transcriptional regulator [Solirubrobacterales bacterium]